MRAELSRYDLGKHIAGAKAAGMNAIWFRPADSIHAKPSEADDIVGRWADIVALLEKRAA